MAFALLSNPNKHFYTTRRKDIDLIVLHVTAGLQDLDMEGEDHSAAGTNRYGATVHRAASWHSCVDSDSIDPALPDSHTAFHTRGYNSGSLGLEISNRDAVWANKPKDWVEATLLNAARVCLEWERSHDIPRRLLSKKQVDEGLKGYSFHSFLDPDRRRDPGKDFPWDYFVTLLASLETGDSPPPTVTPQPKVTRPKAPPVSQLAQEVIEGKHGSGDARKKSLGSQYAEVQREVNRLLSGGSSAPAAKTIDELAHEVLAGKHGHGDARRRSLGSMFDSVQARVNELLSPYKSSPTASLISRLATETIAGRHGSGEARKRRLGSNYSAVQAEVNRRLS